MIRARCRYTKSLDKFYRGVNSAAARLRRELPQNILGERVFAINVWHNFNFISLPCKIESYPYSSIIYLILFLFRLSSELFHYVYTTIDTARNICTIFFFVPKIDPFVSTKKKMSRFFSFLWSYPLNRWFLFRPRNSPVTDRLYETFQHLSSARSSRLTTNYVRLVLSRPPRHPPRVLAPNLTRISLPRPGRVKTSTAII